jgi:hypothetical protein
MVSHRTFVENLSLCLVGLLAPFGKEALEYFSERRPRDTSYIWENALVLQPHFSAGRRL